MREFLVTYTNGTTDVVEADEINIEEGNLLLVKDTTEDGDDPLVERFVLAAAPGQWCSCRERKEQV